MAEISVIAPPMLHTLRRFDHTVGRIRGRRTVLIEARTPLNLAVLRPVFDPLLHDDRLHVLFTGRTRDDLTHAFEDLELLPRLIPRNQATWTRVDLYMNSDPWDAVRLRRVDKQICFFHGVAGKYDLDCPAGLSMGFDRYDCVAFPNAGRRDQYVAANIVSPQRAALIGYPKIDALISSSCSSRGSAASLGFDSTRPTAIFAPTFSTASALNCAGEDIVQTLLDSGCNVIVKLHDRSLDPDPRYSGGVDWRDRLTRFNGSSFLLAPGGDSTPYMLASDVMVTDHSSIGFEFYALDRPLIVFDAPGLIAAARINLEKLALLRSAATVVNDMPSLAAAVENALARPTERSADRRRVAGEVFYQPGTATARALRRVYELLQLAPATHPLLSPPQRVSSDVFLERGTLE